MGFHQEREVAQRMVGNVFRKVSRESMRLCQFDEVGGRRVLSGVSLSHECLDRDNLSIRDVDDRLVADGQAPTLERST